MAFTSYYGLHSFVRMPFALQNAPRASKRTMELLISKMNWQYSLHYFDNIVLSFCTVAQQIDRARQIPKLLRKANETLKNWKCISSLRRPSTSKVTWYFIWGREIASHTRDTIKEIMTQQNVTNSKSFLGLGSTFTRFGSTFARTSSPLRTAFGNINSSTLNRTSLSPRHEAYPKNSDMLTSLALTSTKAGPTLNTYVREV